MEKNEMIEKMVSILLGGNGHHRLSGCGGCGLGCSSGGCRGLGITEAGSQRQNHQHCQHQGQQSLNSLHFHFPPNNNYQPM